MNDLLIASVVAIGTLAAFRGTIQQYQPAERSLLFASLFAHLLSGAALVPLVKNVLKGGDIVAFDEIGRALLDRLFRAPGDTISILTGLLLHAGDPLPVPDYGLAVGSSGAMITFSTVGLLLTFGSLYGACVLVAGLSFFGKLCIYDVFRAEFDPRLHRRVLAATLLVPSTVFWSSGLIKEAFAMIGMGLVFRALHRVYRRRTSLGDVAAGVIGLCIIGTIKAYLLIPLGIAAAASVLLVGTRAQDARRRLTGYQRVAVAMLGAVLVFGAGLVSSRYNPSNVVEETARQQNVGEQLSYAGSHYSLVNERSLTGEILATPLALVTAFFRPSIFEARNAQSAANGLETLFFTILTWRALRRGRVGYRLIRQQPILLFCSVFSLIMAVGVGLASTNLGTLSRYRVPMMPFLWVVVTVVASKLQTATASNSRGLPARSQPWVRTGGGQVRVP